MSPGTTIYFIRHGETDWNAAQRYQGQKDIPLNDKGRGQALRNGETLRTLLPDPAALDYVASPLSRARETMEIVRTALGLPGEGCRFDDRLREVHYGHWEGSLASDLVETDPDGLAARSLDPYAWRPRGGESYADLMVRTTDWLRSVDRDTVVASHGGVSRTLRGAILALPGLDILTLPVPQDRILVLTEGAATWK